MAIEKRLQSVMPKSPPQYVVDFSRTGWESGYTRLYPSIKSYEDIKNILSKPTPLSPPAIRPHNEEEWKWRESWREFGEDTNTRIIIMRNIVAENIIDLLSQEEKDDLEKIAKAHLDDDRMCAIGYSTTYADEEDTSTVCGAARTLLSRLKN